MNETDRLILNRIQSGFPITSRPFFELANDLELSEDEILERVQRLKLEGVIRRIGAVLDSSKMQFSSTLCAARVPEAKIENFIAEANRYPGVTHNYLRKSNYNVWFTFIATDMNEIEKALKEIRIKTGVKDILNFPAIRKFKIKVDFKL
jgi:DNA-binding Lrp family transcriptional regulator